MIKPHGSDTLNSLWVSDEATRQNLIKEAQDLPQLLLNSAAAANVVMLGAGYFNPLTGFMNVADAVQVGKTMHTTDGLFWPVPILNRTQKVDGFSIGDRIALRDPNVTGNPVMAIQTVEAIETLAADVQAEMIQQMAVANRAVKVREFWVKPSGALHHGHGIPCK